MSYLQMLLIFITPPSQVNAYQKSCKKGYKDAATVDKEAHL